MMKELRCIVFSDKEILQAIVDRRRKLNESLPDGTITGIHMEMADGFRTTLQINNGQSAVEVPEQEVQAALLSHCMAKNVPLPADADKSLYLIKGRATLMITMNFQKSGRLVGG